jgi:hypothetical protein
VYFPRPLANYEWGDEGGVGSFPLPILSGLQFSFANPIGFAVFLCQSSPVWQRRTNHASSHIKLKGILTASFACGFELCQSSQVWQRRNKPSPFLQNIIEELTAGFACGFELCQSSQVWQRRNKPSPFLQNIIEELTASFACGFSSFAKPTRFGKGEQTKPHLT